MRLTGNPSVGSVDFCAMNERNLPQILFVVCWRCIHMALQSEMIVRTDKRLWQGNAQKVIWEAGVRQKRVAGILVKFVKAGRRQIFRLIR